MLSELLNKIKEAQAFAEEKIEDGAPDTLNARRGRQARAVEEIGRLEDAYTNELRRSAAFIVVSGDKTAEFSEVVSHNKNSYVADPEDYFNELVNRISPKLYLGRETVANLFDVLGRHIEEKSYQLGIVGYPQLIFKQEYQRAINNKQDFLNLVKEAVTDQLGGEIVGIQATKSLTKLAIERSNTSSRTSIVLTTSDEKFGKKVANDLTRISSRVFFVSAGTMSSPAKSSTNVFLLPEVTEESVKKLFSRIQNSLKKNVY